MARADSPPARAVSAPLYVYGFVRSEDAHALGPIGIEVGGVPGEVTAVMADEVAAMVSPSPAKDRVMPMRKNIDAQNRVLRELLSAPGGVIPLRFGHVVRGEREVKKLLSPRRAQITHELQRLAGKVEMALRVVWSVDNLFDYLVSRHPPLAAMRERMFAGGNEPSREQKIDIGRAFASRVEEERVEPTRIVTAALEGIVDTVKELDVNADSCVMDLAMLVDRKRREELEKKIDETAASFSDAYEFRFTGPFAPFHFVGLELGEGSEA